MLPILLRRCLDQRDVAILAMQVKPPVGVAHGTRRHASVGPLDLSGLELGAEERRPAGAVKIIADENRAADQVPEFGCEGVWIGGGPAAASAAALEGLNVTQVDSRQ